LTEKIDFLTNGFCWQHNRAEHASAKPQHG
jgi:hypothetical protein